jgi:PKD repeat protein
MLIWKISYTIIPESPYLSFLMSVGISSGMDSFEVGNEDWMRNASKANYTLGHAVADLIDNSIDAESSKVEVQLGLETLPIAEIGHPKRMSFYISDNGMGMSGDEIVDALNVRRRAAGYSVTDLGAFGLGTPSSSLSQGYHITVFSKQEGGEVEYRVLSIIDLEKFQRTNILNHFDMIRDHPELLETKYFKKSMEKINEKESGTVVLVQFNHRNVFQSETQNGLQDLCDTASKRLLDYLGLVFEHYLNGVELPDRDGVRHEKRISIFVNEREVKPLDPLLRGFDSSRIHNVRGSHIKVENGSAKIEGQGWPFKAVMSVIPKRDQNTAGNQAGLRPTGHDDRMSRALAMRREGSGNEGSPITDCQGLYLYRNMRLIEFGCFWKGIRTGGANYTTGRMAVYCPVGIVVNDITGGLRVSAGRLDDFSTDPTKTFVNCSDSILEVLNGFIDADRQWFPTDDRRYNFYSRSGNRSTIDRRAQAPPPPPSNNPVVEIVANPTSGLAPMEVSFEAMNVGQVDATEFFWNLGDSSESDQEIFTHQYDDSGIFNVTLRGKSDDGETSATVNVTISVEDPSVDPEPSGRGIEVNSRSNPGGDIIEVDTSNADRIVVWVNEAFDSEAVQEIPGKFSDVIGD